MSAPQAPDTSFDTLIVEPVPPMAGTGDTDRATKPESLSVITTDPKTGVRTGTTADDARPAGPQQAVVEVRKRFTELDGLRGAAALAVVVFHLRRFIVDLNPPEHLDQLIRGGYLMVDLFFVLSGFVLARSMLATTTVKDLVRFSSLRARRFLPLHLTGMAIAFSGVLLTWVLQQYDYQHAPDRAAFSIAAQSPRGYLSALLLVQGFVGPQFAGYAAAWSLSIELWTNVLIVAAIVAVPWAKHKRWIGPAAVVVGTIVLVTRVPGSENTIGTTAFGRGLTGLGAGMVIFWAYSAAAERGMGSVTGSHSLAGRTDRSGQNQITGGRAAGGYRPARWPAIGAVLGLVALMTLAYFFREVRELRFLPVIAVASGLIFCLAQPSDGPAHRLMNSRVVQWLGSRSFALYALHGPVLLTVSLAARLCGVSQHDPRVAAAIIVTTLVGALLSAEFGHRFIERALVPKKSG